MVCKQLIIVVLVCALAAPSVANAVSWEKDGYGLMFPIMSVLVRQRSAPPAQALANCVVDDASAVDQGTDGLITGSRLTEQNRQQAARQDWAPNGLGSSVVGRVSVAGELLCQSWTVPALLPNAERSISWALLSAGLVTLPFARRLRRSLSHGG